MCYDDAIHVAGDYQSDRAVGLQVSIVKCSNSTDEGSVVCKSDEEIQKWLARKFLLTMNNQKKFNQMEHDQKKMIEKHSHLNWNPINSRSRQELVNEVQIANVST